MKSNMEFGASCAAQVLLALSIITAAGIISGYGQTTVKGHTDALHDNQFINWELRRASQRRREIAARRSFGSFNPKKDKSSERPALGRSRRKWKSHHRYKINWYKKR
ncbi:MAG: hypothetical protein IM613_16030 [Cytophagales bacterium]|nr:hypothetical protein [Cytophagales bacterium]